MLGFRYTLYILEHTAKANAPHTNKVRRLAYVNILLLLDKGSMDGVTWSYNPFAYIMYL